MVDHDDSKSLSRERYGRFAQGYVESPTHAEGTDLDRLIAVVAPRADWVALDVKAPFADYARITSVTGSGRKARQSALEILRWGGPYELRTTVHPSQWTADALWALARELSDLGVSSYAVQRFRPQGCADARLRETAEPDFPPRDLCRRISSLVSSFELR